MSGPTVLRLPADCTLRAIKPLHADLSAALAGADVVALDCAQVERVDIAFVQLVLAAGRTAGRHGKQLGLASLVAPVETAFRRAGGTIPLAAHQACCA
jgi:phospholipid transport system transporter-binding protein